VGIHGETSGQSLDMEFHGSCYGFYHKDLSFPDTNAIVNRTIFFNYNLINRSNRNYKNLYVGVFNDVDLGNYADDFVGCDSLLNTGFAYNAESYDDLPNGFGKNPPIIFCKFLNHDMTNFMFYHNDATKLGNPSVPSHFYGYLRSSCKNDTNFTGNRFLQQCFPCSNHFNDSVKLPSDRRFLMSTNTAKLNKDSAFELEFANILLHNPDIDFLKDG